MELDFSLANVNTIGVVGLGLIGGSYAKAYRENTNCVIYGTDKDPDALAAAIEDGTLDGELTDEKIPECDLILVALYPEAIIDYIKSVADRIRPEAYVIDTGGLKRNVCKALFPVAADHGFTFIGGHPMAGKKTSGYKHSTGNLFKGASMILVPDDVTEFDTLATAKAVFAPCGFGRITICSAEKHDEMIAFTSELAHIVSNAYMKSPTALSHRGFSAGSYKDMTRVAWLNETMWTEIFMDNRDNLIKELDAFIQALGEYRDALKEEDRDRLWNLLHDGKMAKEAVDGK
ncbi:MAG: prephenate dehydrogenase [Eubacterium sp.]|nr:prephenate dehydrogenase [Eubacterium sp.]